MTFTPGHRFSTKRCRQRPAPPVISCAFRSLLMDFIEHRLAGQPAVHRLGCVEPSRLEQLVRRRSAATPTEIAAVALACFHAAADFAADGLVERGMLKVGKPVRGEVAECKAVEARMTRTQELRREGRYHAV